MERGFDYFLRANGSYWEAVKGSGTSDAGKVVYGGSGNNGGVDGTDVAAVIQAAFDDGSVFYFDENTTFSVETMLSLSGDSALFGGTGATLQMGADLNALLRLHNGTDYNVDNVLISGLDFDTQAYNKPAIYFSVGADDIIIDGCSFTGYNGVQGWLTAAGTSTNIQIRNCAFDTLTGLGINMVTADYSTFYDGVVVDSCRFSTITDRAIQITHVKNVSVTNNKFDSCAKCPTYINAITDVDVSHNRYVDSPTNEQYYGAIDVKAVLGNVSNITVSDNHILWTANPTTDSAGIVLHSETDATYILRNFTISENVINGGGFANVANSIYIHGKDINRNAMAGSITGNTAYNTPTAGISVTFAQDIAVTGNYCSATLYGLHLATALDCTVTGNRLVGGTTGLLEDGTSDYNVIQNNDCRDSTTPYDVSGANNTYDEKIISDAVQINGATTIAVMTFVEPAWLARVRLMYETAVANDTNIEVGYGDSGGADRDKYVTSVTSGVGAIWTAPAETLTATKDIGALDTVTFYQDGSGGAGEYIRLIIDVLYGA